MQVVTDRANLAIANTYDVSCGLSIGIFTVDLGPLLKVKIVTISTVNISQMVTDMANIVITNKWSHAPLH